jgi:hypothetical protein
MLAAMLIGSRMNLNHLGPRRRLAARILSPFLMAVGLVCLLFPPARLFLPDGPELITDTRAWLGQGRTEGLPPVAQVHCMPERSGTSRVGITAWNCNLTLGRVPIPKDFDVGATARQAGDPLLRGIATPGDPARRALVLPTRLERELPSNRTGQIPQLRLLSAPGAPPLLGVVWGAGDMAWRWASWAIQSVLFLGFGGACVFVAVLAWRRPAPA